MDFKLLAASYETSERFAEWIKEKKLESTEGIGKLREAIPRLVQPVFPFTKLDAKNLVDQPKNVSSNVTGLRIAVEERSPEAAQRMVSVLGQYVIDSITYLSYSAKLESARSELKSRIVAYDNVMLNQMERLGEFSRRSEALRQIVKRYPESANLAGRQVVSVTDESARYLPPVTLLATAEIQEFEAREAIHKAKLDKAKSALLLEYYDRLSESMKKTVSGEVILHNLETLKESVFRDKSLEDELVREVHNSITIANQIALDTYLESSRFIAGPTLPTRSTARPMMTLVASFLVGLACAIALALAKHWWTKNRAGIVSQARP